MRCPFLLLASFPTYLPCYFICLHRNLDRVTNNPRCSYVVAIDVTLTGESANTAPVGTLTASSFPYSYSLLGSGNVKAAVTSEAGQTLGF